MKTFWKCLAVLAAIYAVAAGAMLVFASVTFVVSTATELIGLAIGLLPVALAVVVALWAAGKVEGQSPKQVGAAIATKVKATLART